MCSLLLGNVLLSRVLARANALSPLFDLIACNFSRSCEETNACLPIEISADEQLQEAHALNAQMQAELEEFRRLRTPSHARMLDEFEDEYAILDETSQHKILGGGAAVEEVTCHELDFYKLHIANFLVQRISKFAERRRGGSISLALAIEASCDDDTGPIALHMRLTGECTGRGGKSSAGGGHSWSPHSLDASTRSVDSHGRRFDSQSPQRNSASSRFDSLASPRLPTSSRGSVRSPREMSMKSPRFRYSATNCDPKWGFRHEVHSFLFPTHIYTCSPRFGSYVFHCVGHGVTNEGILIKCSGGPQQ